MDKKILDSMSMRALVVSLLLWSTFTLGGTTEKNVALWGTAIQSSDWTNNNLAVKAIDGDRNSVFSQNSCSCTKAETNPWWRVNLRVEYIVTSVTITNRGEYHTRINGAEIRVGNSLENNGNSNPRCAVISSIPPGSSSTFYCHGMKGRYVNVLIPRYEYLTLCEVEVHASPVIENVALKGRATQSSQFSFEGAADKAIDGNRHGVYPDGSCSHTKPQTDPWWRVDLLDVYRVTSVNVTNRQDAHVDRIKGAEIRIGNSLENNGKSNPLCATISSIPPGYTSTFKCPDMEGRYVTVIISGGNKVLTLCEVEVIAYPTIV